MAGAVEPDHSVQPDQADVPSESSLPAPTDPVKEREQLIADATGAGVDPDAAADLAERLGQMMPGPLADRYVDRRIATGYTVEEAEQILLNDVPDPTSDPHRGPNS